jgi:hypothetical protein
MARKAEGGEQRAGGERRTMESGRQGIFGDDMLRKWHRTSRPAGVLRESRLGKGRMFVSSEEMKNKSFFVQKSVKMRKSIGSKFIEFCFISIT